MARAVATRSRCVIDRTLAGHYSALSSSPARSVAHDAADVARLEGAHGALPDIGELVVHHRVLAGLIERELDEAALCGLEVGRLRTAPGAVRRQLVVAFLVDGVEDRADDVEGGVLVGAGIDHPHADALA